MGSTRPASARTHRRRARPQPWRCAGRRRTGRHRIGAGHTARAPRAGRRVGGPADRRRRAGARPRPRRPDGRDAGARRPGGGRSARARARAAVDHRLAVVPEPRAARRMACRWPTFARTSGCSSSNGATLVRLDPGSAVLTDGDGCAALTPVDLAAARPDPFCRMEDHWLAHLEEAHPEVLIAPRPAPAPGAGPLPGCAVRPLGVDCCYACAWRPCSATTTCAWPSPAGPRPRRSCGSRSTGSWDGVVRRRPIRKGAGHRRVTARTTRSPLRSAQKERTPEP